VTHSILTERRLALGLALSFLPVWAHAQLRTAEPAAGATLSASPSQIACDCSEGVEPKFSRVSLANATGESFAVGRPTLDAVNHEILKMEVLTALKPAAYVMTRRVVSVDVHKTQGSFTLTLAS
jgi:methionine-rich copper-binding protein CopC